MPAPHLKEFREDVVAVARKGDTPIAQLAADFGISESCLRNWMHQADVEDGVRLATTAGENAELQKAKRKIRLLEQKNEVLARAAAYLSQADLRLGSVPKMTYPLVLDLVADGIPVSVTCGLLGFSRQAFYPGRRTRSVSGTWSTRPR